MKKYLFLDDERFPKGVTWCHIGNVGHWNVDWQIVRSLEEAKAWVLKNGFPDVISFDHDLGEAHYSMDYSDGKTGYDFAKWLINSDMLGTLEIPTDFNFLVHSLNLVGLEKIQKLVLNYLRNN